MSNNPPLLSLLNVMDFTTVAGIKATLSCLTRLICLLLSKVPKGEAAYVRHFLGLHTPCQLTFSYLFSKPLDCSSAKSDLFVMSLVSLHSPQYHRAGLTSLQHGYFCTDFKMVSLPSTLYCLYKNMTMLAMVISRVWRQRQQCQ